MNDGLIDCLIVLKLPTDERKRLDASVDLTMKIPKDYGMFPFWFGPFTCLLTMSGPEYIKACVANAGKTSKISCIPPSPSSINTSPLQVYPLFMKYQKTQACFPFGLGLCHLPAYWQWVDLSMSKPRGGTDLERGYGDVRPWRPPFHASPAARKGPISSKRASSQDPLLRKFGNFSLNSLNFHPNFSSQAPKFGNFPLTSPPFQRQMSVRKPHTSEIQAAHPYLKKSWVPPPGVKACIANAGKTMEINCSPPHFPSSCFPY